ncbi:MAG: hypothetical protein AAGC93_26575 [Cyanobacteria bacterium P01_F01_bin.53]
MTPQLEAAIAAIQPLSPAERQQLLQILTQSDSASNSSPNLKALSNEFWQGIPLQQLRSLQSPATVRSLQDVAADFWPPEDSIEDFLSYLREQRQEVN